MVALVLAASMSIVAPHACDQFAKVDKAIREEYKEEVVQTVVLESKIALQVYANKDTWTMVMLFTDGTACLISAGKGWPVPDGA